MLNANEKKSYIIKILSDLISDLFILIFDDCSVAAEYTRFQSLPIPVNNVQHFAAAAATAAAVAALENKISLLPSFAYLLSVLQPLINKCSDLIDSAHQQYQQEKSKERNRTFNGKLFVGVLVRNHQASLYTIIKTIEKVSVRIIISYVNAVSHVLAKERENKQLQKIIIHREHKSVIMEQLKIVFHDIPEVFELLECFTSMDRLESALIPYEQPIVQERTWFIWQSYRYEMLCPLEMHLYSVLVRFNKEILYSTIVQPLRANLGVLRFFTMLLLKALEMDTKPELILARLHEMRQEVYDIALKMICQWVLYGRQEDAQANIDSIVQQLQLFNQKLPQIIEQLRHDLRAMKDM